MPFPINRRKKGRGKESEVSGKADQPSGQAHRQKRRDHGRPDADPAGQKSRKRTGQQISQGIDGPQKADLRFAQPKLRPDGEDRGASYVFGQPEDEKSSEYDEQQIKKGIFASGLCGVQIRCASAGRREMKNRSSFRF